MVGMRACRVCFSTPYSAVFGRGERGGVLKHALHQFRADSRPTSTMGDMLTDATVQKLLSELVDAIGNRDPDKALRQFQAENPRRIGRDGYTWAMYKQELIELEASLRARRESWRSELRRLLDQLCEAFFACDAASRTGLRTYVAQRQDLCDQVHVYAFQVSTGVTGPQDVPVLRRGLAAVSVENCAFDVRDTLMALANLYVGAEEVGIDPRRHFSLVAGLSDDARTRGGCGSMANLFREFESYAVVQERRSKGPY